MNVLDDEEESSSDATARSGIMIGIGFGAYCIYTVDVLRKITYGHYIGSEKKSD
jgi:23S rRNA A1618 N6-methylase RlmF